MNHLTEEQFEDLLAGTAPPAHLAQCPRCQDRLAEKQAIARRLQRAFAAAAAPSEFTERIRRCLDTAAAAVPQGSRFRRFPGIFKVTAAAAAVLAFFIPLFWYLIPPARVQAAQAELVQIHQHNLQTHPGFYSEEDPVKLADYLKNQLGFTPALPRLGQGMAIKGCCVSHFRGKIAGSYVVDTPSGFVSVIVVDEPMKNLGLTPPGSTDETPRFWKGSFSHRNMVGVRLHDFTYCAVGSGVSHETLTAMLTLLVPE